MSGKETVKFGYLTKSPPENKSAFHGWKKRYFILIDSIRAFPFAPRHLRIEYYNNYEDSKLGNPLGLIELNNCSGVLKREQMKSHKHVFDIVTPSRVYHLSAESMEEREEWVELLNTNIFLYNQLKPAKNNNLKHDPSRRSSDFMQESDISQSLLSSLGRDNNKIKGGPRAQSLRVKSAIPISPQPLPDVFVPTFPDPGSPNALSTNLKIISSVQKPDPEPIFADNEILSEKGFTSVPTQKGGPLDVFASLPIGNESPYMNVGYTANSKSTNASPTHPMRPAPYKKVPVSLSMDTFLNPKLSDDPIQSEYTCINPSNMGSVLEEYAKVKKHK